MFKRSGEGLRTYFVLCCEMSFWEAIFFMALLGLVQNGYCHCVVDDCGANFVLTPPDSVNYRFSMH
jgi:hypothetical protein